MICQPPRHAARRGNDIDIAVAVVLAGKSDRGAVRGEEWKRLSSYTRREAMRLATFAGNDPQVSGIVKHDVRLVHRWKAQKKRRIRLSSLGECNCKEHQYGNKRHTAHV